MEENVIFEKVQKIVAHQLGIEKSQVTATSSFTDDLGADSLDTGVTRLLILVSN